MQVYAIDDYVLDEQEQRRWRVPFAFGLALALHAGVIFGIGFTVLPKRTPEPVFSLNISLVEQVGGETQEAGGANAAAAENLLNDSLATTSDAAPKPSEQQALPLIDTVETASMAIEQVAPEAQASTVSSEKVSQQPAPLSLARLESTDSETSSATDLGIPEEDPDERNRRVREKTINPEDSSTLEGYYAENWRLKVEQVATLNFPKAAQRLNLTGKLTLDVALRADGSIDSIELVRSSGHAILDNAARQIVLLAAPYQPFPEELRKHYDILHIIRTWEFDPGRLR